MGKRVLVADDSATIQKAFAMVFGGQDVSLVAARSLEEALTSARQSKPDLVIADAALGARTGYELCAALKADPALRGTPVYILSSTHTPYDEARGREANADGNLIKPFESQSIIDKVNEILARAVTVPSPVISAPAASPPVASAARPATGPVPSVRRDPRDDEDDYGEVIIERPTVVAPAPAAALAPAPLPATRAPSSPAPMGSTLSGMPAAGPTGMPTVTSPASPFPGLRPSLIPGARPGAGFAPRPLPTAPPAASAQAPNPFAARPAPAAPAQPAVTPSIPSPAAVPPAPASMAASPAPTAQAGVGRTMMGMPAVMIPGVPNRAPAGSPAPTPGMPGSTPRPAAPGPGSATPFASVVPAAAKPAPAPANTQVADLTPPPAAVPARVPPVAAAATPASAAATAISARVEQKLGAFAARGPEYEAIARLSRELIEEVVWEVVPELAEIIIREHVERLAAAKK